MTIKEKAVRELESMDNNDVRLVYDIIQSLKRRSQIKKRNGKSYLDVRKALKNVKSSLSEDIKLSRKDRI